MAAVCPRLPLDLLHEAVLSGLEPHVARSPDLLKSLLHTCHRTREVFGKVVTSVSIPGQLEPEDVQLLQTRHPVLYSLALHGGVLPC